MYGHPSEDRKAAQKWALEYWVVDYSITENAKVRRKQEYFRIDPDTPRRPDRKRNCGRWK